MNMQKIHWICHRFDSYILFPIRVKYNMEFFWDYEAIVECDLYSHFMPDILTHKYTNWQRFKYIEGCISNGLPLTVNVFLKVCSDKPGSS